MSLPVLDDRNFDADRQHWIEVRVYYEDTDFTGMVYHANYLRFFERGRSDCLRDAGVSHQDLLNREDHSACLLMPRGSITSSTLMSLAISLASMLTGSTL